MVARILFVACLMLGPSPAVACSRALFNKDCTGPDGSPKPCKVYVARTMDWMFSFNDTLIYNPKGEVMTGIGEDHGDGNHPYNISLQKVWRSAYWSVTTSTNDWLFPKVNRFTGDHFHYFLDGATEGFNEKGLVVHLLYLGSTEFKHNSPAGVQNALVWPRWVRYLLDLCDTAACCREKMREAELIGLPTDAGDHPDALALGAHIAVEDPTGDSAIFEQVEGRMHIHPKTGDGYGRDYRVMANDPSLEKLLRHRNQFIDFGDQHPGGLLLKCNDTHGVPCQTYSEDECKAEKQTSCMWKPKANNCQLKFPRDCLEGDITSWARFNRLSYFLHYMIEDKRNSPNVSSPDVMLAKMRGIILGVAVPTSAPDVDEWDNGVYPTQWYSLMDFDRGLYMFGWYENPNVITISRGAIDQWPSPEKRRIFNPRDPSLHGDVTDLFSTNIVGGSGPQINYI